MTSFNAGDWVILSYREGDQVELKSIGLMVLIEHFYEEIVFDEPQLANQVVENVDVI